MNLLLGSNKWSNHVYAISSTHRVALLTSEEMNMPTTFLLQELLLYMFVNTNPYFNNPQMQIELSKFLFKTSTNHACIKNKMGTSQCKFAWREKKKRRGEEHQHQIVYLLVTIFGFLHQRNMKRKGTSPFSPLNPLFPSLPLSPNHPSTA